MLDCLSLSAARRKLVGAAGILFAAAFMAVSLDAAGSDGFVLIPGGSFRSGGDVVRVDSFEILDHPITNLEYAEFVSATRHAPPLHWEKGRIPRGMEQWPVTFVNRNDVAAYCQWRSKKEGRVYRLPMAAEFEYAARGGLEGRRYPWGDDEPAGRANFDGSGERTFAEWRKWVQPVKSFAANPYGLFDMAGNVWQMVLTNAGRESLVKGGSWARPASWLRFTASSGTHPSIQHPDLGFRPVRAPAGSTHFSLVSRAVLAAPAGEGSVHVGWRMLASDTAQTGYHVYRSSRRDACGERLTPSPIMESTNFLDRQPPRADRVWYYRVRPVDRSGKEGAPSEWAGVVPGTARTGLIAAFRPGGKEGPYAIGFGDLDGDGSLDAVIRSSNGFTENSRDPGIPAELEAFTSSGRQLWRRPLARHNRCGGLGTNLPFNVYDLNGDGKAEVIARVQEGEQVYLAVLGGMTGEILRKTPWREAVGGYDARAHMSIAYLDGKTPAIVTQTGLYENEVLAAYSANLTNLWTFRSFGETSGSGSHYIAVADVDDDGRDEIFDGTTVINPDGRMRWSLYRRHPDIVSINHILAGGKDRQVFYAVETGVHAGAYVVDAKTGKIIWKQNGEDDPRWRHAHLGWVADIWDKSPGLEILANRDGHDVKDKVLLSSEGKILVDPFVGDWRPVNWTGRETRDLMSKDGRSLGRFTGSEVVNLPERGPVTMAKSSCPMVADLAGDFRDEMVCWGTLKNGTTAIQVFSNIEEAHRKEPARTEDREYRMWIARTRGGVHGYPTYFEWQPRPVAQSKSKD